MQTSLPSRLRSQLQGLARKYDVRGIDLFVFGSFARGDYRPNSDLDLGVEWRGASSERLFRELCKDIENLPTIRKIDLVDFSRVSQDWRQSAWRHRLKLSEI